MNNISCELSYNKKYPISTLCSTISNIMGLYDPHKFANWLTSAYKESKFKSWQEVADAAKTTRSTLSRYAGAKPQTLTGKPSQPEPELAVKLAEVFGDSVDKVLLLAGHAPTTDKQVPEEIAVLFHGAENWNNQKRKAVFDAIKKDIDLINSIIPDDDEEERNIDYLDH